MSSDATQPVKLPPVSPDDKDAYPLSSVRAHPSARKVIDLASVMTDRDRGQFILEAAFEKAIVTLGKDRVLEVLQAA